jgi:hypothetical protein
MEGLSTILPYFRLILIVKKVLEVLGSIDELRLSPYLP